MDKKEQNRKRAKVLIANAGFFYTGSVVGQWRGYDIFFAESEKGKHDGPGLLVDGERFRWVKYDSKEWQEIGEALEAAPE